MAALACSWLATSRRAASQEASRDALQKSGVFGAGVPLVTEITPASTFWCGWPPAFTPPPVVLCMLRVLTRKRGRRPAEMYHQDYYLKKAPRYKVYRYASGRDAYIESIWCASAHAEPAAQQM